MLTRRRFGVSLVSLAGLSCAIGPEVLFAAGEGKDRLSVSQRRSLLAALAKEDENYDPAVGMLRARGTGGPGYHTTVKSGVVHSTRSALTYAAALLDSGEEARLQRAKDILRTVIALQDQNPQSKTYGIWSWYLEEPLAKMSPPDWNWADFCGVQLLAAWIGHHDRLGEELAGRVREAIQHAARSIERRNVQPGYTNIAVMGTYGTLVAAQEFGLEDLRDYARTRLRNLHAHTMAQGSFSEFNSPTYSVVLLAELSRMLLHVRVGEDRKFIRELHDLAWKHVATHFHAPTRQWAGPHSRCYETDLHKHRQTLAFLDAATGRKARLIEEDTLPLGLDAYRLPLECPPELVPLFCELPAPRQVVETFLGGKTPVIGTTWLHPRFTLGSVNRGHFWNQMRALLAYWGTPEKSTYLRVRFLHDDYDFCSALLFTAQHEGCGLATMVFATDHGDTHPGLDPLKNGVIEARDLRLRFELNGGSSTLEVVLPKSATEPVRIQDRGLTVRLHRIGDSFDGSRVRWELGESQPARFVDAVFHSGEKKRFDLKACREAFVSFALEILPPGESPAQAEPRLTTANGRASSEWKTARRTLRVETPVKPGPRGARNGEAVVAVTAG
ncbi:MAG: hypothetical protein HZA90_27870 [Verrucomicrobia bacterium]|nr:hypothetical protein [Verrucomicrobiota bacterium]